MKRLLSFFTRLSAFRLTMLVTSIVLVAVVLNPTFLLVIESKALDAKFRMRGVRQGDDRVAIIAIDEKSISELGRWPWPRWTHAKLVDELKKAGAAVVAFDIVFSEPDQNSELIKVRELRARFRELGLDKQPDFAALPSEYAVQATDTARPLSESAAKFYQELAESERRANSDATLAESLAGFKDNIVLGYFFFGPEGRDQVEGTQIKYVEDDIQAGQIGQVRTIGDEPLQAKSMLAVVPNIAVLNAATENYGHFYMLPDPEDGVIRWNHLVLPFGEGLYPSLGLKAASLALQQPIMVEIDHGAIQRVRLGDIEIPTDEKGGLLVNYAGPTMNEAGNWVFDTYSFTDIMNGRIPPEELKDRIFLVGPTAVGIYDLRNTPFDAVYPGVGIHANVVDNILTQNFLTKPALLTVIDLGIVLMLGLGLGLVLSKLRSFQGAMAAFAVGVSYYIFTQYAFTEWGVWLSIVYPSLEIILLFGVMLTYKYMTEERQARQIRGAFQSYVTPSVVESVLENPDKLKLGGETRDLTVMFSDVRGFTTISEQLTSEQLVELLNAYLSVMTDLVFESEGTLDKYIGDALMAIWGAPVEQPDNAKRACYTALDMVEVLEKELKPRWAREGLKSIPAGAIPPIDIGIGLNSGMMTVGNMGSSQRFDYTVMGDNVNLASRLEGTTKQYGIRMIVSEFTRSRAGDAIVTRELDSVRVKGKTEPVRIYELVGKKGQVSDALLEKVGLFEEGLGLYRATDWDRAQAVWTKLLQAHPDDETTRIFLKRIEEFRRNPVSAGWDGVYEMKTK